jgi:hypothetical protein
MIKQVVIISTTLFQKITSNIKKYKIKIIYIYIYIYIYNIK